MSRSARPIAIDCELQPSGTERELSKWVEATRIIMKILERKRIEEEVIQNRPYQFSKSSIDFFAESSLPRSCSEKNGTVVNSRTVGGQRNG